MSPTDLVDLSHLARRQLFEQDVDVTWDEYRRIIERAIDGMERTLQTRIGPSELGSPCDACLIEKLAEHTEPRTADLDWLPTVGKAVHAWLEEVFVSANEGARARFLVETTVCVGQVGGMDVTGHADLYDGVLGEVTDWKIVGETTLRKVKAQGHPGPTYRRQAHLYGRGFVARGLPVKRVRVAMLPRNAPSLRRSWIWTEPYDEQVALDVLAHADMLARAIQTLGYEAVASSTTHTGVEFSCERYSPDPEKQAAKAAKQLKGLLPPTTPDDLTASGTTAA